MIITIITIVNGHNDNGSDVDEDDENRMRKKTTDGDGWTFYHFIMKATVIMMMMQ